MTRVAQRLEQLGYILRSGGAKGADTAFEQGAKNKQIFYASDATPAAISIASKMHPAWDRLPEYVQMLHSRNVFQVLGPDLIIDERSSFLLCWTPDGAENKRETTRVTGGTGQAIRIASAYDVAVFNLRNPGALDRLAIFLKRQS
jgi:hypothetical protein